MEFSTIFDFSLEYKVQIEEEDYVVIVVVLKDSSYVILISNGSLFKIHSSNLNIIKLKDYIPVLSAVSPKNIPVTYMGISFENYEHLLIDCETLQSAKIKAEQGLIISSLHIISESNLRAVVGT